MILRMTKPRQNYQDVNSTSSAVLLVVAMVVESRQYISNTHCHEFLLVHTPGSTLLILLKHFYQQ